MGTRFEGTLQGGVKVVDLQAEGERFAAKRRTGMYG
jgi:hypothetical protein